MGSDDEDEAFNTSLSLDLHGFTTAIATNNSKSNNKDHHNHSFSSLKFDHVLPSLSLALVDQAGLSTTSPLGSSPHSNNNNNNNRSPNSMKGSLAVAVAYGDEVEQLEKLCSRASDEDHEEPSPSPRKKLRLSKQQSSVLEDSFNQHSTLTPNQKEALAKQLNLRPRQVEVWFQNRRARTKLKQTEMECELMRKCWEKLTEENNRLKKELTELKSLKVGAAVYMSIPAATLSMCPSCETFISDAGDQGGRLFSPA